MQGNMEIVSIVRETELLLLTGMEIQKQVL